MSFNIRIAVVFSFVCVFQLCRSQAKLNFTSDRYGSRLENIHFECLPNLDHMQEYFVNLTVSKDDQVFYKYNNDTAKDPQINGVNGIDEKSIEKVKDQPGLFNILNANKDTAGHYKCEIFVQTSTEEKGYQHFIDIKNDTEWIEIVAGSDNGKSKEYKSGEELTSICNYHVTYEQDLLEILVVRNDTTFFEFYDKDHTNPIGLKGLEKKNINYTKSDKDEVNLKIKNATEDTAGTFGCVLTYTLKGETNKSNYTIKSATVELKHKNGVNQITVSLVTVILAVFTYLRH